MRRPVASTRAGNRVVRVAGYGAIRRSLIKGCGDSRFHLLCPIRIPLLTPLANRVLAHHPGLRRLDLIHTWWPASRSWDPTRRFSSGTATPPTGPPRRSRRPFRRTAALVRFTVQKAAAQYLSLYEECRG